MTTDTRISINLRRLREEIGWTQSELARRAGLVPSAISMIEAGKRQPRLEVIQKICGAFALTHFNVSIDKLTGSQSRAEHIQQAQEFYCKWQILAELNPPDKELVHRVIKHLRQRP